MNPKHTLPGLILLALAAESAAAPPESADQFVARINRELMAADIEAQTAGWIEATYITGDTENLSAKAEERKFAAFSAALEQAKRYAHEPQSEDSRRAILLLKLHEETPAPADPAARAELARLDAKLEGMYGSGHYCPPGSSDPAACKNIDQLSHTLATSRDYDELTEAWREWHTISPPMRADYTRFVELANQAARDSGFADLGAMWRSGYDMPPDQFQALAARLYGQVEPLYKALHCYVRSRLAARYGAAKVPERQPIPAQLLGNMWAQQWNNIADLVVPYPEVAGPPVDRALESQHYDAPRMFRSAETFYTSLGFPSLPDTFWQRSMMTRPRDREVVCHPSAWHIDFKSDVRIKMCTEPTYEDLKTIYHEMGHTYYDLSYQHQPYLFESGANDGFHEAIGDTVTLSMTPGYLAQVGLIAAGAESDQARINRQMQLALEKIAFLPFGKLIDEWRWRVFSGEIKPANYNQSWWAMKRRYQGVSPPLPRSESDFDPGAKYHVPANTPYTRYFLSFILQFQFHRALCQAAGYSGPLDQCSVYGNKEAGARFRAMLAAGQSRPWQETLQKLTGTRDIDASAITDYFAPLMAWLNQKNQGQSCGWEP
jgi:peptidyl-dipeptidase A